VRSDFYIHSHNASFFLYLIGQKLTLIVLTGSGWWLEEMFWKNENKQDNAFFTPVRF
jgi:hypothetical protein